MNLSILYATSRTFDHDLADQNDHPKDWEYRLKTYAQTLLNISWHVYLLIHPTYIVTSLLADHILRLLNLLISTFWKIKQLTYTTTGHNYWNNRNIIQLSLTYSSKATPSWIVIHCGLSRVKNTIYKPLTLEEYTIQGKYCDERFLSYNGICQSIF